MSGPRWTNRRKARWRFADKTGWVGQGTGLDDERVHTVLLPSGTLVGVVYYKRGWFIVDKQQAALVFFLPCFGLLFNL